MSAVRSILVRATKVVARSSSVFAQATRPLSTSANLPKEDELVAQREISVSSFAPDANATTNVSGTHQQYSIPVRKDPVIESSAKVEEQFIYPLSKTVYGYMPSTMQKSTIMGKVVIITGGARGLGNHMARACAEAGAKAIIIFDANKELGEESAAELHHMTGLPIQFYAVDVRNGGAIIEAVNSAVEKFGAPDVLVNSAGIADSNIKAEEYDHAAFRRLIDTNLTGSFMVSQAVGKAMIAAGKAGSIVLVASISGSIVNHPQEQSCYNASKAGVVQLGKSLAVEWAKHNIRVNSISPGYMDTELNRVPALDAQKKIWIDMTPQKRLGAVDDLNGLAIFLASDASGFMTGANVAIDGGYTLW